jgi:hypothetical protein
MIVNYRRWCAIGTSTDSGRKPVRSNFPNTTTTTQARSCSQRKHKEQQDPVLLQGPKFFLFSFYLTAHYPRDQLFPTNTSTTDTATAITEKYSW